MIQPVIRALIHLEMCCYQFCLYQRREAAEHLERALQHHPALFRDGGVYFRAWLDQRPVLKEPRADFHAWIKALLARVTACTRAPLSADWETSKA